MSIAFYTDVHVPSSAIRALRSRGVDLLTAQDDQHAENVTDEALLERASMLGRVLVTQDEDFLVIATRWQRQRIPFAGILYSHQLNITIGKLVDDLELIAKCGEPSDLQSTIDYLPL